MSEITRLLGEMQGGDPAAAEKLLCLVYPELRQMARRLMEDERPGHTLQPTVLADDAWMRLAGSPERQKEYPWTGKAHFLRTAAMAMRQALIDHARKRNRRRRGGGQPHVNLDDVDVAARVDDGTLLAVDEALQRLEAKDKTKAALVELRFFLGMSVPQAAETLGISPATAKRHWRAAQAWLYSELKQPDGIAGRH